MDAFLAELWTCLTVVSMALVPVFVGVALVLWGLMVNKLLQSPRATARWEAAKVAVIAAVPVAIAAPIAGAATLVSGVQLPLTLLDAHWAVMLTVAAMVVGLVIQQRAAFLAREARIAAG